MSQPAKLTPKKISPAVNELVAQKIMERLEELVDFPSLITLPLDVVGQCLGLGPAQVRRRLPTRPMGVRKRGVSLRDLLDYQAKEEF
jgi:hypothetical protein